MKDIATYPCAVMVFLMVYDGIITSATSHSSDSQWDKNLRPDNKWDRNLHPDIRWDSTLQTNRTWDNTLRPYRPWNNTLQKDSQLEKNFHPDSLWGKIVFQEFQWGTTLYPRSPWDKTRISGSQWDETTHLDSQLDSTLQSHSLWEKIFYPDNSVTTDVSFEKSESVMSSVVVPDVQTTSRASVQMNSQSASPPTKQPINCQSAIKSAKESPIQPTKQSTIQSINQSAFQSPSPSSAQSYNQTGNEKLRRTQLSQTTWSVTPLDFQTRYYEHNTDAMFHVPDTNVMTSFPHFDLQDSPRCQADKLILFKVERRQGDPEYTPLWSHCGERYIAPQVYSHSIAIRFISDGSMSRTGFKMLYSVHPMLALPQRLDSGLFNCSVPHYPTFQLHFHCNLETECVAGEDEAHCPYTSTDCGAGNIDAENKCYRYVTVRKHITWYDADVLCRSHGERLVMLRSFFVTEALISKVLKFTRITHHVLVGVNTYASEMQSLIPHAMSHSYYMSTLSNTSHNLHCANVDTASRTKKSFLISCDTNVFVYFVICERDTAFDDGVAVRKEAQSHVYNVDLFACGIRHQYIPVWDGTVVEANLVTTKPVSFKCVIYLLANEGQYVTTVIETFRLAKVREAETDESTLDVVDGSLMRPNQANVESLLLRSLPYDERDFVHPVVIASGSNIIYYLLRPSHVTHVCLRLRVLVSNQPGTNHLLHVKTQPNGGYVTSFAFDGLTVYARKTMGTISSWQLGGNGITKSFRHFDLGLTCQGETGKLEVITLQGWVVLLMCGRQDIPPLIYSVPVQITFSTGSSISHSTGFKMLYSVHPVLALPQRLESGLFNCSVPHYPTFQLHFHCNLETECVGGEDEAHCPYTSTNCGAGDINAGNKCYRYVTVRRQITWYNADEQCRSHGERLVSPRTPTEWVTFRTSIGYGKKTFGVFVGLSTSPSTLHSMYKDVWRWADQTMAFYVNARGGQTSKPTCAHVPPVYTDVLQPIPCDMPIYVRYVLCERDKASNQDGHTLQIHDDPLTVWTSNQTVVHCPKGHVTHDFLSCDLYADCGVTKYVSSYPLIGTDGVPLFACDGGSQTLHYTLVCDHRQDCSDGSDETWCVHAACPESHVTCKNQQCVRRDQWCDGMKHCQDGSDEDCPQYVPAVTPSLPPPAVVSLDGHGGYTIRELGAAQLCPVTHFRCSQHDYCLPVYLRCNGVYDCVGREDEAECGSYTCPGLYRCRASSVCVHSEHVCDGVFQCPQQDDEWLCDLACPQGCRCQGLALICNQTFGARSFPSIRYLDAGGSGMSPHDLGENHYLVRLSLSQCSLTTVANMTLPNLRWLDLSANVLTWVSMQTFIALRNLRVLRLAANPMTSMLSSISDGQHINLHTLDLSGTHLVTYDGRTLAGFPRLMCLNISHGALSVITADGLNSTPSVQVLDVRGSPLDDFPRQLLRQLASIDTVYASNFKLCCPAALPNGFNPNNCHAPIDEIASCDDLLRSNAYRVFLWLMAAMAITGNAGSMAARVLQGEFSKTGFHVFVTNLCVSDLLMGVYLIVIGGADLLYRGHYLWNDKLWRGSVACQVAGFLSLLSNEVSAFFICLITLDRFLALRFPLSDVRFHKGSALAACAVAWTGGFLLALVPLLPMTSEWAFYSQTGICIPLPITRTTFGGGHYSFGVMVVLNFILFVLIALGQALVFLSVRKNSIEGTRGEQDLTIARRLTTIVLSDFLCWFPIGLLGLLAATGTPISSELNVGAAIFVLPFNSAINPFLYTINVIMEKRRKAAETRLLKLLMQRVGCRDLDKSILKMRAIDYIET